MTDHKLTAIMVSMMAQDIPPFVVEAVLNCADSVGGKKYGAWLVQRSIAILMTEQATVIQAFVALDHWSILVNFMSDLTSVPELFETALNKPPVGWRLGDPSIACPRCSTMASDLENWRGIDMCAKCKTEAIQKRGF